MTRSKPSAAPEGFQPGGTLARELRFASANSYDSKARTVEGVFAAGSPVRRWGFVETLNMEPGAVDLSRVAQGQCKLLDSHNAFEIDAILGVVEEARIENSQLIGRIRFAETDAGKKAEGMVARGELTGFSIGYSIKRWVNVSQEDTGVEEWRADEWALLEVTLCAVPADPAATVRAAASTGNSPGSQTEDDDMTRAAQPAAAAAVEPNPAARAAPAAPEARTTPPANPAPPAETVRAEPPAPAAPAAMGAREAVALLQRADFYGQRELAERMIGEGRDEATVIAAVQEARRLAGDVAATIGGPRIQIGRDETETRRRAISDALAHGLSHGVGQRIDLLNEPARQFSRAINIAEFAADYIGHRGRLNSVSECYDVYARAMTTSDFPIMLEGGFNIGLRARYMMAQPKYRRYARQRTYLDFRDHTTVQIGDFPQLQKVLETGEIKAATFGEAKETTRVDAYGVQVKFSRQLIINDHLNGIQQMLSDRASEATRLEDRTFFTMMTSAAGAGPMLQTTTRAVFNTTDKTLAAANAAITTDAIGIGAAAMMQQKTIDGNFIYVYPSLLLCGPDKWLQAQKVLRGDIVATKADDVGVFRGQIDPDWSPWISGNAWYLFADPANGANFEWGLLSGFEAPRMRIDNPFGTQGLSVSLEHDFGCGAIDYRFGFRNAGA